MADYSTEVHENPEADPLYDKEGDRIPTEGGPEKEPIRKGVAGVSAGSVALIIVWGAEQIGWQVPTEVALAIAGLIGAVFAYAKKEY